MTTAPARAKPDSAPVIGESAFTLQLLEDALAEAGGATAELVLIRQRLALTRFARGRVHQNVEEESARLVARVWSDDGRGIRVADGADALAPRELLAATRGQPAHASPPTPHLPSTAPKAETATWFDSTAAADGEARTAIAAEAIARAGSLELSGHLRVAVQDLTVVNSAGLRAHVPLTFASFIVSAVAEGGVTGSASRIDRDLARLSIEEAVDEATRIATASRRPLPLADGDYRVILDPAAVSMLLLNLGIIGLNSFSAAGEEKGSSFIASNRGEAVASSAVTLVDDGQAEHGLPVGFDLEGCPKQQLTIIDRGIAAGVAHDLETAARAGVDSTGHGMLPGAKGPTPTALRIESGSDTRDDLIAGLGRGIVIRRIHPFVSLRGGPGAEVSGTSRDGVFVVENGEIAGVAANLRWSCSAVDLLRSVEAVSRERSVEFMDLPEFFPSTNDVPSLLCGRLHVHGAQPRE